MPVIFSKKQLGKNRVDGFYETPIKTVELMANKVLPFYKKGMKICDPCVGDGIFLKYLLENGVSKNDLYGYDIDLGKIKKLKNDFPNVKLQDSTKKFHNSFDIIIGNPPYAGDEFYFIRENRERLNKDYKRIKPKNLFSIISFNSINHLNDNGLFIKILSDAFLTNIYYKEFRNFLLEELEIFEIILTPRNLFRHIYADVGTCVLFGKKRKTNEIVFNEWDNNENNQNKIKLVDRLKSEEEYNNNSEKMEIIKQNEIFKYPNNQIIIGAPKRLRDIYLNAHIRLKDIAEGGTGISTGNDKKFLKLYNEIDSFENWVPYYKNASRQKYFYKPKFFIEKNYAIYAKKYSNYLIRNENFFFKEGISCSSVGIRFSASYMPKNSLFGVNANFFFKDRDDLFYTLALMNTKLCWYFARRILIRTNNISSNYLKLMPIIFPKNNSEKKLISNKTEQIVNKLQINMNLDTNEFEKEMDNMFFDIYEINEKDKNKIVKFTNNFYDDM